MISRAVRLSRFGAAAAATVITVVSAWAFVNSTASIERDPFRFTLIGDSPSGELRNYGLPDLLAPPPACLGGCS